jgi:hypothetical protein
MLKWLKGYARGICSKCWSRSAAAAEVGHELASAVAK